MKRTEYFNHTRPSETQLNYTEDSKIAALLERARSSSQFGVVSGFRLTTNALDATKIDIGLGEGYTGGFYLAENIKGSYSGERISTYTEPVSGGGEYTAQSQALADYTLNAKNYVTLVYTESSGTPLTEKTFPFTPHNTIVSDSYTVSIKTATQWGALTADQLANLILLGIVTANGPGVPLDATSIDQVVQPLTHPTVSQPSTITGITITGISPYTLIGNSTLRYVASTNMLYWAAPSDSEGSGVNIPTTGTYVVYSSNTSYYIAVDAVFSRLPASGTTTETLTITSLYGRAMPVFSSVDQAHRDMLGTGLPTVNNPHGLTISDLESGSTGHADLFHANGISCDAEPDQLYSYINVVDDSVVIKNKGSQINSFLINGKTFEVIYGLPSGADAQIFFDVAPPRAAGDYLIYLDAEAKQQSVLIAEPASGLLTSDHTLWSVNIDIYDMHNNTAGSGARISWDATAKTLTYKAPSDSVAGDPVYVKVDPTTGYPKGMYKLFSSDVDNYNWVIVNIIGDLGVSAYTDFSVYMNTVEHSDDQILRLAVVAWGGVTNDNLYTLRDIRRFVTADNRPQFEEEHDQYGRHTKPIQSQLSVAVESQAFYAQARSSSAAIGHALVDYGVVGTADRYFGVAGYAASTGVIGSASVIGVYGTAVNSAVVGKVTTATGVFGDAQVQGVAGVASDSIGVFGSAGNTGVFGTASSAYGVYGQAPNTAVYAIANASAGGTNIVGLAAVATNSVDDNSAIGAHIYVSGVSATGIYASASKGTAVYATGSIYGVVGTGPTGIYGIGAAIGVAGSAANTAVFGSAATATGAMGVAPNTGVVGSAATAVGIYGIAPSTAVLATASASAAINVVGLVAQASNASVASSATGASIAAPGVSATALIAAGTNGTAIYATGSVYGVYAACSTALYGTGTIGVYGAAATSAVVGIAAGTKGVYGEAPLYGVYGTANQVGVYGTASSGGAATITGVYAEAQNPTSPGRAIALNAVVTGSGATAIAVAASNGTGIYTSGSVCGLYVAGGVSIEGTASGAYFQGSALGIEAVGTAANGTGVYGRGQSVGVEGTGSVGTGVHGHGALRGMYAIAEASTGVNIYGVSAIASNSSAVGTAYGLYGNGFNAGNGLNAVGVYGTASATGMFALAGSSVWGNTAVGIKAEATNSHDTLIAVGVSAAAKNTVSPAFAVGVLGAVADNSATGVYGYAPGGVNAVGVMGIAAGKGVAGGGQTGVYGAATNDAAGAGIYGQILTQGIGAVVGAANAGATAAVFGAVTIPAGSVGLTATGVYGVAVNSDSAGGVIGVKGDVGVVGTAVLAVGHTAFCATGTAIGGFTAYGLYVDAQNTTTPAAAVGVRGGVGGAGATAIYGVATAGAGATAIYGNGILGGVFRGNVTGISVSATAGGTALIAYGPSGVNGFGVYGNGYDVGVYGQGSGALGDGVAGHATRIGVYGTAGTYGGYFECTAATGMYFSGATGLYGVATATGIYVAATASAAKGIYVVATHSMARAICGEAAGVGGIAGSLSANSVGITVYGGTHGAWIEGAQNGIYCSGGAYGALINNTIGYYITTVAGMSGQDAYIPIVINPGGKGVITAYLKLYW